jgi:hypothetical protein
MQGLSSAARWERHPERNLSVARGIYLRLPDDARLWLGAGEYATPDRAAIGMALMLTPENEPLDPDSAI